MMMYFEFNEHKLKQNNLTKEQCFSVIDKVMNDIDIEHTNIYIIHSDFLEGANHFKQCFIEKGVPEQNIHIDYISSVIAVHTGLGCIAIQYIREEN